MDIVLYVDKAFKGERRLDEEITTSPEVKRRYDEFMKMYDGVMVEPFSFGTMMSTPFGQFFPSLWLLSMRPIYQQINCGKNSPEIVQLYKNKLVSKAEQARGWILDHETTLAEATKRCATLLLLVRGLLE